MPFSFDLTEGYCQYQQTKSDADILYVGVDIEHMTNTSFEGLTIHYHYSCNICLRCRYSICLDCNQYMSRKGGGGGGGGG